MALQVLNFALALISDCSGQATQVEEDLLTLFCKVGYEILPHKLILETSAEFKTEVVHIISHTAFCFPSTMSAAITSQMIPLLRDHDHLAGPIASIVVQSSMGKSENDSTISMSQRNESSTSAIEHTNNGLAAELLGEIGNFEEQDSSGIRNLGHFIMELAQQSPECMLQNVRTVLPLLNKGDAMLTPCGAVFVRPLVA